MITHLIQEFYSKISKNKDILSIDYGSKKLGLATSSLTLIIPMPLKLLKNFSEKEQLREIIKIVEQKNIGGIVIGLPLNMNGTYSDQTILVEKFTQKLDAKLQIPIFFQDERLTSRAASNFLKQFDLNRKSRDEKDDLASASMILESALATIKNMNLK